MNYTFTVKPEKDGNSSLLPVFVFSPTSGIKNIGSTGGEKINLRIDNTFHITKLDLNCKQFKCKCFL